MINHKSSILSLKLSGQYFLAILLFSILFLSLTLPVSAQSFSLSIDPPVLEILIKPGKTVTYNYKITNDGDPGVISATIVPFIPGDQQTGLILVDCNKNAVASCQAIPWINLAKLSSPLFLKSKQIEEITISVRVPKDAAIGDYYLTLLIGTEAGNLGDTGSKITGQIGTNLILTVSEDGNTQKDGEIAEFDILSGWKVHLEDQKVTFVDSFDEIPVRLVVANHGNNVFTTTGSIKLSSPFLPVAIIPLGNQNIVSGSSRLIKAVRGADDSLSLTLPGSFYLGSNSLLATISLEDIRGIPSDDQQSSLTATAVFIALPVKLSLAVIFSVLAIYKIRKGKRHGRE